MCRSGTRDVDVKRQGNREVEPTPSSLFTLIFPPWSSVLKHHGLHVALEGVAEGVVGGEQEPRVPA